MNEITELASTEGQAVNRINMDEMNSALKIADVMVAGKCTLPKHLQGQQADCFSVILQAMQWGMNPFAVAQATSLINGTLAYSAQLVAAVAASSGAIDGGFKYEYSGEWKSDKDPDAWVRCGARLRGDSDITWGERLYPATVTTKNSPLWKSNPKQQSSYLACKLWARLNTPGAILGVVTRDDIEQQAERDVTPRQSVSALKRPEPKLVERDETEDLVATVAQTINKARSQAELKKAGLLIQSLDDLLDGERGQLREIYALRLKELKAESESMKDGAA